jgi:hypothetical protein
MAEFTPSIDYRSLSPEKKLKILEEMGFSENPPDEHASNCPDRQDDAFRCDCIPPTTSFKAPLDVKAYMGESLRARRDFGEKRSAFVNDGDGEDPGLWITHLEKTAPRYNS